ncbi:transient receptor potential cation channel subfamily V member 1-like [Symsagittifera roscoffensis]|uniref:transient receptor potential cation channel subfamily V member 1-like n=1 Tax=Symsagittifera roscoffensis TaxID=84072 RepID=UPI00307C38FD
MHRNGGKSTLTQDLLCFDAGASKADVPPTFLCSASFAHSSEDSSNLAYYYSMNTFSDTVYEIHQLIDREGNGLLLNLYLSLKDDKICLTEFVDHLRNLVTPFLYNKGEGQLVTPEQWVKNFGAKHRRDFQASRRQFSTLTSKPIRDMTKMSDREDNELNMSSEEFQLNSFLTLTTHLVCWKLEHRGRYGETPLHFCYFINTPEHLAIANYLLELFPKLAIDKYEGDFYFGQNCLHFCITHSNSNGIEKLIECGADVNARACGTFFIPQTLKLHSQKPVLLPDYQGQSYFGEYPLAFAACLEHYSIFDQLYQEEGTNPNFQDCFGNTLAHLLVIHNKPRFLYYALKLPRKRIDLSIKNQNGLTPLQLACHLGYYEAFQVLADARSQPKWSFGHLESKTYLIDQLDSIHSNDGSINWNSGLHLLCMGSKKGHTDIINRNPLVDSLLRVKWQTYVKRKFGFNLILSVIYLLILIAALYFRPSNIQNSEEQPNKQGEQKLTDMIKFGCEITLFTWSLFSIPFEWGAILIEGSKHVSKGRNSSGDDQTNVARVSARKSSLSATLLYLKMVLGFKDKLAANLGSLLLITAGIARVANVKFVEDICLATSIPLLFGNLLFYCRCFSHLGPFITIYYHMIRNTLTKLIILFFIVILGSHCILFFLFNANSLDAKNTGSRTFSELISKTSGETEGDEPLVKLEPQNDVNLEYLYRLGDTLMFLVHTSFGEINMNFVELSAYPSAGRLVIIQHGVLVTILLGCLMTAMVCATYQKVLLSFRAENKKQWARIILLLEAQMSKSYRLKKIAVYADSKSTADPTFPTLRGLGLVVTSIRENSDAFRRNRAWNNWRILKYELRKRHFKVHDSTVFNKKLALRTKKRSSDPFRIEQLKETRRRVSVNRFCRSGSATYTARSFLTTENESTLMAEATPSTLLGNQLDNNNSEYSEINTPPMHDIADSNYQFTPRQFNFSSISEVDEANELTVHL